MSAPKDASDVIYRNDSRTRYINYYGRQQNTVNAIINIDGGSGAANEASELTYLHIGRTMVTAAELETITSNVQPPVNPVTTLEIPSNIVPLAVVVTSNSIYLTDGSSNLYILTPPIIVPFPAPITAIAQGPLGVYVATGSNIYVYSSNVISNVSIPAPGLSNIIQMAVSSNAIFVLEGGSSSIYIVTSTITTVGSGPGFADGNGVTAQFNTPMGIIIDPSEDYLYIADTGNSLIRKINTSSPYIVSTIAGNTTGFYAPFPTDSVGNRDGNGLHGQTLLYYPKSITISPISVLYIADTLNNNIRQLTPDGNLTTIAGVAGVEPIYDVSPPGYVNAVGSLCRWNNPSAITYYNASLYITEPLNRSVRILSLV
jgi:hypothetical protein